MARWNISRVPEYVGVFAVSVARWLHHAAGRDMSEIPELIGVFAVWVARWLSIQLRGTTLIRVFAVWVARWHSMRLGGTSVKFLNGQGCLQFGSLDGSVCGWLEHYR